MKWGVKVWFDEGFPIEDMKKSWKGGLCGRCGLCNQIAPNSLFGVVNFEPKGS